MEDALSKYYIKGFNNGYFLAKYQPNLLQKVLKVNSDLNYVNGLKDGKKAFEMEKTKNRIQELNHHYPNKNLDLDF